MRLFLLLIAVTAAMTVTMPSCKPEKRATEVSVFVADSTNTLIEFAEVWLTLEGLVDNGAFASKSLSTDFEGKVYFYINPNDWPEKTEQLIGKIDAKLKSQTTAADSLVGQKEVIIQAQQFNSFEVVLGS